MIQSWPRALGALLLAVALAYCAVAQGRPADDPPASREAVAAYREALSQWEAGRPQAAVSGFTRAVQLAPAWGAPHARLGVVHQLAKRETEARQEYALAQAPALEPAQRNDPNAELLQTGEALLIYLINDTRMQQGLPVLVPDATVGVVARRHSEEMRDKSYFEHTSPTPRLTTCQDRFFAIFGYRPRLIAENLARRWGRGIFCLSEPKVRGTHVDLMNSPGHRHNILYPSVTWIGVGMAANANGDYWVTEVFVEPGR